MNRKDYLDALGDALYALDPAIRMDLLLEMGSHIDGLAERRPGSSEEEIVAGLTPVDALAKSILEEYGAEAADRAAEAGTRKAEVRREASEARAPRSPREPHAPRAPQPPEPPSASFGEQLRRRLRSIAGGRDERAASCELRFGLEGVNLVELSFAEADLVVQPGKDVELVLEAELRGLPEALGDWEPELRSGDGRLSLADSGSDCVVTALRVLIPPELGGLSVGSLSGDMDIEVEGTSLRLSTKSGDVRVQGAGHVDATSVSGDINIEESEAVAVRVTTGDVHLEDCAGPVALESLSGDLAIVECSGTIAANSASGDISVTGCPGPLALGSSSGDISLDEGSGFEGGTAATISGDLSVELEGANLELRAETVSGELDLGDLESPESVPKRLRARVGRGGPELKLSSVSGDISADF